MTPQRIVPRFEEALPFKVNGVYCRFIPLTQKAIAIVSAKHYPDLIRWGWYALKIKGKFYAARKGRLNDGEKHETILMHRYLLGLTSGRETQGDHADLNTLNNLLTDDPDTTNLRLATDRENHYNKGKRRDNTSGFKGAYFDTKAAKENQWSGRITVNGKQIHLGMFATPELANKAYEKAAKKYFGKFARSN